MSAASAIIKYLPAGSLRSRIAHGTLWTLIGSITAQVGGMLGSILSAHILGAVGFGELGMIRSTVLMFGVLAGTGLGLAATKYVSELRVTNPLKAGRMIGLLLNTAFILGGSVTLLCVFLAAPIAKATLSAPHLTDALQVGCLLLLLNTLNGVQLGVICGFEKFRTQSQIIALDGIFNLALVPLGAFVYGVTGAVVGSVIAVLIGIIVKQWAMHKECAHANIEILHRNITAELPALRQFVLPAVLVGLSAQPFDWLARLILVHGHHGYVELGLFTAAFSLSQMILFLPVQLVGPTLPILANLNGSADVRQIVKIVLHGNMAIIVLTLAIATGFAISSPFIMLAYGSEYAPASRTLVILAVSSVFCVGSQIPKSFLYTIDCVWVVVLAHVAMGIVLCAIAFLFQSNGANGLASGYLIGWLVLLSIEYSYALYRLDQMRQDNPVFAGAGPHV